MFRHQHCNFNVSVPCLYNVQSLLCDMASVLVPYASAEAIYCPFDGEIPKTVATISTAVRLQMDLAMCVARLDYHRFVSVMIELTEQHCACCHDTQF